MFILKGQTDLRLVLMDEIHIYILFGDTRNVSRNSKSFIYTFLKHFSRLLEAKRYLRFFEVICVDYLRCAN